MELHQLEYVLAVAKYEGFTRAAEEIKTSQSSLSQQISKLEDELGISLFVRTNRSVHLTPAGEEFIAHAKRIMTEVTEARRCITEYTLIEKGPLSLGLIPIIGYYPIPNLLASFQKNYPGVKMTLQEEQCDELLRMLHASKIDAAIVQHTGTDPRFQFHHILTDEMVVVTTDRHPLASRSSINLLDIQNEKFISTPPTSGHYHDFRNACQSLGFEPSIFLSCSPVRTIIGLVREELGITVLSSYVARRDWEPGIAIIPLTPTINRNLVLAVPRNSDLPPALKVFVKFTSRWVNEQLTEIEPEIAAQ